jgi:HK97 family phage major capsid protein
LNVPEDTRYQTIPELTERLQLVDEMIQGTDLASRGRKFSDEQKQVWDDLHIERQELVETIEERKTRERQLRVMADSDDPARATPAWGGIPSAADDEHRDAVHGLARDRALRTIERYAPEQNADAVDRVDRLVREGDPLGVGARYIAAVGDPNYASAFAKMLKDPTTGHLRFSPEEVEAVRKATSAEFERAFVTTTTGVPVPYELDPSIMISGSGSLNPLRRIARVETVTEGTWKGATSAEVTAAYQAEASEVADATPAMTQPTIVAQRGTAFIPFSFEIGQDWVTIVQELGRLLADGRDVLDTSKMLLGTGTNEPGGLLNIGGTGGLTTAQRVLSAGAGAVVIGDVYALKQALPARFIANATFTFNPTRLDAVYRLVAAGSTTEPQIMPGGRDGPLLGKPVEEWSSMVTTVTTGSRWAIYGDFRNFLITDRLGFSVELIPHLFGAANRFPTGQRGLLGLWRSGSGATVLNGFRYGETS